MSPTEPSPFEDTFALDPVSVERFRADGHVLVEALATRDEIEAFRPLIERAALDQCTEVLL